MLHSVLVFLVGVFVVSVVASADCCKVVDGSLPLAGVLLSLSGSGNYRQNNVTPDGGVLQFTGLVRL